MTQEQETKDPVITELEGLKRNCSESGDELCTRLDSLKKKIELRPRNEIRVRPWWYWPALVLVIPILEYFINYDAFLHAYSVMFFAVGLTILVAASVAFGSHMIGSSIKRWEHLENETQTKFIWLPVASALVLIALVMVGWTRYLWVEGLLARAVHVSVWAKVLPTLGGNVIVLLIGTWLAERCHDKNEDHQEEEQEVRKLEKKFKKKEHKFYQKVRKAKNRYSEQPNKLKAVQQVETDTKQEINELKLKLKSDLASGPGEGEAASSEVG